MVAGFGRKPIKETHVFITTTERVVANEFF